MKLLTNEWVHGVDIHEVLQKVLERLETWRIAGREPVTYVPELRDTDVSVARLDA